MVDQVTSSTANIHGNDEDPPEIRMRMRDLLRPAGPARRLALARSLTMTTRALSWAGLSRRRPECSTSELEALYVELLYGRDLADRLRAWRLERPQ